MYYKTGNYVLRYFVARSRNHCSRGKAVTTKCN